MKNIKRVGLYNPFLDTLGGGELHVLSILQVLSFCGYELVIFWDKNLSKEIEQKFSARFTNKLTFIPNIFKKNASIFEKLKVLRDFEIFIYVTDGSYFFSLAKKNYVFCMVPNKKLYSTNILNKLKTRNYQFIANSQFTGNWLHNWGINNQVLYPYIDNIFFQNSHVKKEKIILSVGRFFPHLHSKQHKIMINISNNLERSNKNFRQYKFILAGGLKMEDKEYFNTLQKITKNNPLIELKPNVTFKELVSLYQRAEFYWHFTGYGVDENTHPEMVEHLGITPLEAMASGCMTFCSNAGGPKEFIRDGKNGFLFNDAKELIDKTESSIRNQEIRNKITHNAKQYVKKHFSYEVFEKQIKKIFL